MFLLSVFWPFRCEKMANMKENFDANQFDGSNNSFLYCVCQLCSTIIDCLSFLPNDFLCISSIQIETFIQFLEKKYFPEILKQFPSKKKPNSLKNFFQRLASIILFTLPIIYPLFNLLNCTILVQSMKYQLNFIFDFF